MKPEQILNWWLKGKRLRKIVPILRPLPDQQVFSLKNGGFGVGLQLQGIDEEGRTAQELDARSARLRTAMKGFDPSFRVYQYLTIRQGYSIPNNPHPNPTVQETITSRIDHLNKVAGFTSTALHLFIIIEPVKGLLVSRPKSRRIAALRLERKLRAAVNDFVSQVKDFLQPQIMPMPAVFSFLRSLLNPEPRIAEAVRYNPRQAFDSLVCNTPLHWKGEYLTFGERYARMWSMKTLPTGTTPNLLADLRNVKCDMTVCLEWRQRSNPETRGAIQTLRKYYASLGKYSIGGVLGAAAFAKGDFEKVKIHDDSADEHNKRLAEVLTGIELESELYGEFSMIGICHSRDEAAVIDGVDHVARTLGTFDSSIIEETAGGFCAFASLLPGVSAYLNVRKRWLELSHAADLSFVYAPYTGEPKSRYLASEYHSVWQTRSSAPFFFSPESNGVRGLMVIGQPGSGKSVIGNFLLLNDQKSDTRTYIIDIGGSYANTVEHFGGTNTQVGIDGPRLNPFALEPTPDNLEFLNTFVEMLLVKSGAALTAEDGIEITKSVRLLYATPNKRVHRLGNLNLPRHLRAHLEMWIGRYGKIFDNEEDELDLDRIHAFDFQGIGKVNEDLIEPLLFWILQRIIGVIHDPANLGTPKHLICDELWKHLKNRTLLAFVLDRLKTDRKHLGGVTLLTHSPNDFGDHIDLFINACPMVMFLTADNFNREEYRRLFDLNDWELERIAALRPRREAHLKGNINGVRVSKTLVLDIDPMTYWLATTDPREKMERRKAFDEHGKDALRILAETR